MVQVINNSVCRGAAGRRTTAKPKGVVIHNTADNASATQHMNRLEGMSAAQLASGFAHYYIDEGTIIRTEDTYNMAWHTANQDGNANYVGYEVCRSTGDQGQFLQAEQNTFKQVAEDLQFWGIIPTRETVRLHKEFSATACPHRSWELHGQTVNAVKDYFISQIKKYIDVSNTETAKNDQSTNENQPTMKRREITMQCLYERPINSKTGALEWNGDAWTVMFCNGVNTRRVYHPDEMKVIEKVYKDNNGTSIPFYSQKEWNKNAPWYNRLESMFPVVK